MNTQSTDKEFSLHQKRFAMERIKSIRRRIKQHYGRRRLEVDLPNDNKLLRIHAVMWLYDCEQSNIEKADMLYEMCTTMEAEYMLTSSKKVL